MPEIYELAVIGGGPAGYRAVEKAKNHFKTAIFEEKFVGGVCLNEGCVPTKTLLHIARDIASAQALAGYGYAISGEPDTKKINRRKEKVIKILRAGVAESLKGADFFNERAVIKGMSCGRFVVETGERQIEAERLLIATGSSAVLPPVEGLSEAVRAGVAVTGAGALELDIVPRRFVVIGGGVIGTEMASIYSAFGSSVSVVEGAERLIPAMDRELGDYLGKAFAKRKIEVFTSASAEKIVPSEDGYKLIISVSGERKELPFDRLLIAAGRRANTSGIGLESIGVKIERGIVTDEYMRTSVPKVWASGDVNGKMMLAHKAYREADAAVSDMLGKPYKVRYDTVPEAVYTIPEVAEAGMPEADKPGAKVRKIPASYSARYVAESDSRDGFVKLVTVDGVLRGVQLAVPYATEIVATAAALIEKGATEAELLKLCFPHPSVSELLLN